MFRNLEALLGDTAIDDVSSQDLYQFLLLLTEGCARSTSGLRYAPLKAFFNFMIESTKAAMVNPCSDPADVLLLDPLAALLVEQVG